MTTALDQIRQKLGREPRRIGFMGFGWSGRLFPIPPSLRGLTVDQEPMLDTLLRQKDIWRGGRIVWGFIVMANEALYLPGADDLPGDVVYSLSATDEDALEKLPEVAKALYEAKVAEKELSDFPEDQRGMVEHLRQETNRAFGLAVPPSMRRGLECHVSSFWAHRAFLPDEALGGRLVPLLVLAGKVHDVLIIPASYWPSDLLIPWQQRVKERVVRRGFSQERLAQQKAWLEAIEQNGPPEPWLDATPESIAGEWGGEHEMGILGDMPVDLTGEGPVVTMFRRHEWLFESGGQFKHRLLMVMKVNGVPAVEQAPHWEIEEEGWFTIEEGVLVARSMAQDGDSKTLLVVSADEILDGRETWLRRTHQPSHEERASEVTDGGSTIYRHKPRAAPTFAPPDMSESNLQAIDDHVAEHIGKIENVWHEIVSDIVHIDVHVVPPRPERPYYTLVTSGMSDLPMNAPEGAEDWKFSELMLCLPPDWPLTTEAFKDERNYWPVRWLKTLARFPHEYETWLSVAHTIPNGEPPEPLADNTAFAGFMLVPPLTTSVEFHELLVPPLRTIHFHALLPLTAAEMAFKLKHGADALMERLEKAKVTELIDIRRKCVV